MLVHASCPPEETTKNLVAKNNLLYLECAWKKGFINDLTIYGLYVFHRYFWLKGDNFTPAPPKCSQITLSSTYPFGTRLLLLFQLSLLYLMSMLEIWYNEFFICVLKKKNIVRAIIDPISGFDQHCMCFVRPFILSLCTLKTVFALMRAIKWCKISNKTNIFSMNFFLLPTMNNKNIAIVVANESNVRDDLQGVCLSMVTHSDHRKQYGWK